jgi:hypothetical protein
MHLQKSFGLFRCGGGNFRADRILFWNLYVVAHIGEFCRAATTTGYFVAAANCAVMTNGEGATP